MLHLEKPAVLALLLLGFLISLNTGIPLAGKAAPMRLEKRILALVESQKANMDIGLACIHIESGNTIYCSGQKPYPLASIFKVPVLIEALRQMEKPNCRFSLQTRLTLRESEKCIGSGTLQYRAAGTSVSIMECLELMMSISDNTATDLVWNLIGLESINRTLKELGLNDSNIYIPNRPAYLISLGMGQEFNGMTAPRITNLWLSKNMDDRIKSIKQVLKENESLKIGRFREIENESGKKQFGQAYYDDVALAAALDNYASPKDLACLFLKVYNGELLGGKSRDLFFRLMSKQKYHTRIPRYLPQDVRVFHKTGSIAGVINDAGIVKISNGSHVILVVFIRDVRENMEEIAASTIGRIARLIYDWYRWEH